MGPKDCTVVPPASAPVVPGKPAPPPPTPAQIAPVLAEEAGASIAPPTPRPGGAPPLDGLVLVGFPTWFWTSNVHALSAEASVPGVTATVTATPNGTTWTFTPLDTPPEATAETMTCRPDAPAYDPSQPDAGQHTVCLHTFDWHGTYRITVTTTWTVSWKATTGQTGTLPDLRASSAVDIRVQQGQATTD